MAVDVAKEKPNWTWNGQLRDIDRVEKLVQHHMAHESWDIYDVHEYHKEGRGWVGIGYNYWNSFDGRSFEGRGEKQGAHAQGHNHRTLGIGHQGNFDTQQMPDEQLEESAQVNAKLVRKYGLDVDGDIIGHGDLAATSCPGANFRMAELKARVKEILGGEDDLLDKAVVYNGDADADIARQLAEQLGCGSYHRNVAEGKGKFAKVLYVVGGGEGKLQAESIIDFSGQNRWGSFKRVSEYML